MRVPTPDPVLILYRVYKQDKIIRRTYSMTCYDTGDISCPLNEKISKDLNFYQSLARDELCDRVDVIVNGEVKESIKWNFKGKQ